MRFNFEFDLHAALFSDGSVILVIKYQWQYDDIAVPGLKFNNVLSPFTFEKNLWRN